jgi:hypothetical protein
MLRSAGHRRWRDGCRADRVPVPNPARILGTLSIAVAAGALGCQSPALVRTARTLPAGGSDLSFSLNVTRVAFPDLAVEGTRVPLRDFTLPNPIPDVLFDHGLLDDVEIGARLSLGSGLVEARGKLRFVEAARGTFHLALAPAFGYRVLALVNGPVLTLPLLATFDLSPEASLSGGALLSHASYSVPDSFRPGDLDLSGDTLYVGAGVGLELRPLWGLHVMPTVEVQRSVSRRGDVAALPAVDMLFLGVTFGWSWRGQAAGEPIGPDVELGTEADVD